MTDETKASEDEVASESADAAFLRLVATTLDPSSGDQRLLVNIIDPSNDLTLSSAAELHTKLLGKPSTSDLQNFAVVDLSICPRRDQLTEELITHLVSFLKGGSGPLARQVATIGPDLSPLSPGTPIELKQRVDQAFADKPGDERPALIVALRGIDPLPAEWEPSLIAAARWTADCFRVRALFLISEKRQYPCDVKLRRPLETRQNFQRAVEGHVEEIARQKVSNTPEPPIPTPTTPQSLRAKRAYLLQLSAAIFPRTADGNLPEAADGKSATESQELTFQRSLHAVAALITDATYPSHRKRQQAVIGLRVRSEALRMRAEAILAATTENAPLNDSETEAVELAEIAAREAAPQATFLLLLDIAFPEIMQAAHTEPNGYHNLFRLQLRVVADAGRTETLSFQSEQWRQFEKDTRVRSFFTFAMGKNAEGKRRVLPFGSATAIKRHSHLLFYGETDPWKDLLNVVNEESRRINEEADGARNNAPTLKKEAEEAKKELHDAYEHLQSAARIAESSEDCKKQIQLAIVHLEALWKEVEDSYLILRDAITLLKAQKADVGALESAPAKTALNNLKSGYDKLSDAAAGEKSDKHILQSIADVQAARALLNRSYSRLQHAAAEDGEDGNETVAAASEELDVCWKNLRDAQVTLRIVAQAAQGDEDRRKQVLMAANEVRTAFERQTEAEKKREENANWAPVMKMPDLFCRARKLWKSAASGESEAGDLIEEALRRLAFLEMVGSPLTWDRSGADPKDPDLKVVEAWQVEIDRCMGDLREGTERSQGALELDACLGIARALTIMGDYRRAERELDDVDRIREKDHLSDLALDMGRAFIQERRESSFQNAEREYERIFGLAREIGARELAARASYGIERCQLLQTRKEAWQAVSRAQVFLFVQLTRSPFLPRRAPKGRQRLFVSYRSETADFVTRLRAALEREPKDGSSPPERNGFFDVWVDSEIIDPVRSDFRPEIQLGLDRSDGFLIVLSPGYFDSHYCTWELGTALARRRLNGQRVDWICVDSAKQGRKAADYARELVNGLTTPEGLAFFKDQLKLVISTEPLCEEVVRNVRSAAAESDDGDALLRKVATDLEERFRERSDRP